MATLYVLLTGGSLPPAADSGDECILATARTVLDIVRASRLHKGEWWAYDENDGRFINPQRSPWAEQWVEK